MKVFVSWSHVDSASHNAAELVHQLLPLLHDSWQPFVSSHNLKAGVLWLNELFTELENTNFGIVCISGEPSDWSWVLFEAGSLAKAFSSSRVVPLLIDIDPDQLPKPLKIFQAVTFDLHGLKALIETLCDACQFTPQTKDIINSRLEVYWKQYKEEITKIIKSVKAPKGNKLAAKHTPKPHTDEQLLEILHYCKTFERRLDVLTRQRDVPPPPPPQPFTVTFSPPVVPTPTVPADPTQPTDAQQTQPPSA